MHHPGRGRPKAVHRRVGGLEIVVATHLLHCMVHRRVGGLENDNWQAIIKVPVHRRVGGLESET